MVLYAVWKFCVVIVVALFAMAVMGQGGENVFTYPLSGSVVEAGTDMTITWTVRPSFHPRPDISRQ
jgi:hypothetical protein